jgi:ABC-type multidrug transport system ATPase subunit
MRKKMLKDVSFKVEAGSFVGICGERGAGKTTMFKLLLRLYDPEGGEVLVGGRNVKEYNPVWLRSQIGLSKQDPAIFTDYGQFSTLRANLMYGSEALLKKLGSPEQIDKHISSILKMLNCLEHFTGRSYPQGLDTKLVRDRLSGGEKRSVANCRAMVSSPPIMLLDEFTAGLDAKNERVVTEALVANRPAGQTVLAVAQTLSTVRQADKIIFCGSDGTIKEQGTWDELVALDGGFAEFVKIQGVSGMAAAAPASTDASATTPSSVGGVGADAGAGAAPDVLDRGRAGGRRKTGAAPDTLTKAMALSNHGTIALERWKSAGIKLRSVHRLVQIAEQHDVASKMTDVQGAIKTLMRAARDDNLPPQQLALLVRGCDSLLHTVKVNDALRPSKTSSIQQQIASRLFDRASSAARLTGVGRTESAPTDESGTGTPPLQDEHNESMGPQNPIGRAMSTAY